MAVNHHSTGDTQCPTHARWQPRLMPGGSPASCQSRVMGNHPECSRVRWQSSDGHIGTNLLVKHETATTCATPLRCNHLRPLSAALATSRCRLAESRIIWWAAESHLSLCQSPVELGMERFVSMCTDMCMDMCTDLRVDMRIDMCTDMCADMCIETCMDICV